MNAAHLQEWITALRTTPLAQAPGVLNIKYEDGGEAACCLGIGCLVAGIPSIEAKAVVLWGDEYGYFDPPIAGCDNPQDTIVSFAGDNSQYGVVKYWTDPNDFDPWWSVDLQPDSFNEWLGLPAGTLVLGEQLVDRSHQPFPDSALSPEWIRLYDLNDHGFTFSQIADLIDYFGVTVWSEN